MLGKSSSKRSKTIPPRRFDHATSSTGSVYIPFSVFLFPRRLPPSGWPSGSPCRSPTALREWGMPSTPRSATVKWDVGEQFWGSPRSNQNKRQSPALKITWREITGVDSNSGLLDCSGVAGNGCGIFGCGKAPAHDKGLKKGLAVRRSLLVLGGSSSTPRMGSKRPNRSPT